VAKQEKRQPERKIKDLNLCRFKHPTYFATTPATTKEAIEKQKHYSISKLFSLGGI
jgi:hypothetical protein